MDNISKNNFNNNFAIDLSSVNKYLSYKLIFKNINSNKDFYASFILLNNDISNIDRNDLIKYLSESELSKYLSIKGKNNQNKYLDNNMAAKYAIYDLIKDKLNNKISIKEIEIFRSIFGNPYIICKYLNNIGISISNKYINSNNYASAIAFYQEFPLAIDLENLNNFNYQDIKTISTDFEIINLIKSEMDYIILWSAKEVISKITLSGLYADFKIYEISKLIKNNNDIICYFTNFSQYKAHIKIIDKFIISFIYHIDYNLININ